MLGQRSLNFLGVLCRSSMTNLLMVRDEDERLLSLMNTAVKVRCCSIHIQYRTSAIGQSCTVFELLHKLKVHGRWKEYHFRTYFSQVQSGIEFCQPSLTGYNFGVCMIAVYKLLIHRHRSLIASLFWYLVCFL